MPLTRRSACQLPLERPDDPNPPREPEVLVDVLREPDVPVDVLRVPLDALGRNAVDGVMVELRRERS